jgi:uncharacterized membrane protein YhaH (DUF805 family)
MPATRLRFWFGFDSPVDRRAYFRTGAGLMLLKYLADVAVVWATTGRFWSPLAYANPVWTVRQQILHGAPAWVIVALTAWTLPFIWIGVSMTMRRAVDAGASAWTCLWFFVPIVNYAVMLWLSLAPTVVRRVPRAQHELVVDEKVRSALLGVAAGLVVTIPTVLLSVYFKRAYSVGLFLGTPFTLGAISASVFNHRVRRSLGATFQVVLATVAISALAIVLFALEGVFCLALAFPIAAALALAGGVLGRAIAAHGAESPGRTGWGGGGGLAALVAPLLVLVEPHAVAPVHEVVTTVEVAAPPEVVWRRVVSFPDVPPPTEWLFRIGVAAPLRARIRGTGVGATRYCDFTTGAFVEPITAWEEGRLLAFDITAQAPPMREWSPYRDVNPPHLDGYFRATHGEFRLTPLPGGRTRLEGRTTYVVDMFPQSYWTLPAGGIVAAIHRRVLHHIKFLVEERRP